MILNYGKKYILVPNSINSDFQVKVKQQQFCNTRYIYTNRKLSITYRYNVSSTLSRIRRRLSLDPRNGELAQSDLRVHLPRVVNGSSASRFINNEKGKRGGGVER